jgi:hypothetical protein
MTLRTDTPALSVPAPGLRPGRLMLVAALLALAVAPGELGALTREMMAGALVDVAVFVAATLLIFYGAEKLFGIDLGQAMQRAKGWQVPIAAFLGATPGCGGAVVVVAAYTSGKASFGAVVATLTATMGDAAFLLIATRPEAAAVLIPVQFAAGIVTGWLVDRFVTSDYRPKGGSCVAAPRIGSIRARDWAYLACLAPGLVVGAAGFADVELTRILGLPVEAIALAGVAVGLAIWAFSPVQAMTNPEDPALPRMAEETAFISTWVILAYLGYNYIETFGGLDLTAAFAAVGPLLPLIGAAIGLIPGCGPQVVVATLYINGAVPFSTLVANAVSNDGDALLPAIALAPRAAVMATLFTTLPALVLAYGFQILAPGFLN